MRHALLVLLLWPLSAAAQPSSPVTLDVQPRSFVLPQMLTVTWGAPATATGCTASGGWSGAKPPSGTEQVAGIVGDTVFALGCTVPVGPLTLQWTHPTQNTDGSAYTDAQSTEIYHAANVAGLPSAVAITVPYPQTQHAFTGLATGTHHFATKAVNASGTRSAMSASVSAEPPVGTAPSITVTGTPAAAGVVSVSGEGYAVKPNELRLEYVLDGIVGTVQLNAPCDGLRPMGDTGYYAINRAKYVTWTTPRRTKTVVVRCAAPHGTAVQSESAPLEDGK